MSGFASGVQAGLAMSNQWMDTYERAKRRGLMAKATNEKDFEKHSQESADRIRQFAEAKDEFGNQKYQLEIDPGSTQYRYREIKYEPMTRAAPPPGDIDYDAWERQYGLAKQDPTAVAEAVPPIGMEERVLRDNGSRGVGYGVYNTSAPGLRTDDLRTLGPSVAMPPMQGEVAGAQYMDLPTSAGEYTPTLDPRQRPEDTDAYRRLVTRTLGEPQVLAGPDKVSYFGREYDRGAFTREAKDAALMDQYARVYAQLGEPEQAMQMRVAAMGLRKGQLDLEDAERTATKKRTLSEIDTGAKDFWKSRTEGRQPTFEDNLALTQWRAGRLIEAGMVDEAEALGDKMLARIGNRLNVEKAERDVRLPAAIMAARSGDLKPITEVYNKFVPDGAQVQKVTNNPDGSVTVHRRSASGADLPDYTFKSMAEFTQSLEDLLKPGAFEDYVQQSFMNNLRTQENVRQDKELKLKTAQVGYEGQRVGIAARNAAAARTIPVIGKDGRIGLMRTDAIKYGDDGMAIFPEGVQPYRGSGQIGQGELTKEQETALRSLQATEQFKDAEATMNDPNATPAERQKAAAMIQQMLRQRKLPTSVYDLQQYEDQPMP